MIRHKACLLTVDNAVEGPLISYLTCRWGADYLLKTLVYDTSSNGTGGGNFTGLIYQVGNLTTDSLFWGRPEDITMSRPYYIASSDSFSDLGETHLSVAYSQGRMLQESDPAVMEREVTEESHCAGTVVHSSHAGTGKGDCRVITQRRHAKLVQYCVV